MKKLIFIIFLLFAAAAYGANEDFTTYDDSQDENGEITVDSAAQVSWVALDRDSTAYVYKDKTASFFSGDFTHQFEMQYSAVSSNALIGVWCLTNAVGDMKALIDASADFVIVRQFQSARIDCVVYENGGSGIADSWTSASASTPYFITVSRDDDGGGNSTGRYTVTIRITSHSGAVQDTLGGGTGNLDCSAGEQNDFRYIYCVNSYDDATADNYASGYCKDMNLDAAPSGINPRIVRHGKVAGKLGKRGGK